MFFSPQESPINCSMVNCVLTESAVETILAGEVIRQCPLRDQGFQGWWWYLSEVSRASWAPNTGSQFWRRMSLAPLVSLHWALNHTCFFQVIAFHQSSNRVNMDDEISWNLGQDCFNTLDNLHKPISANIFSPRTTDYTTKPPSNGPSYVFLDIMDFYF